MYVNILFDNLINPVLINFSVIIPEHILYPYFMLSEVCLYFPLPSDKDNLPVFFFFKVYSGYLILTNNSDRSS